MIEQKKLQIVKNDLKAAWANCKKQWLIDFRYPTSFLYFMFAPILWMLPFLIYSTAITGGRYSAELERLTGTGDVWVYTGLGMVFTTFIFVALWSTAFSIRREEWTGTLEPTYIAPCSRYSFILGQTLHSVQHNGFGLITQMIIILWWYRAEFDIFNLAVACLFLIVGLVMVQSLAMILSAIVLWQKEGYRAVMILEGFLAIITPAIFPLVVLTKPLRVMAYMSPFTYAVLGFKEAILFGVTPQVWQWLGVLILMNVVLFYIGIKMFGIIERHLRRRGLIGQY